ncbi:MAG: hypothetical protein Q8R35_01885 [bacterium]|nr:hypothetical protein [bacterium]
MSVRQTLSPALRLELAQRMISSQLRLVGAVRGEHYRVGETCPRCHHRLTAAEIIHGFRRDPHDLTTRCRRCRHRFPPKLELGMNGSRAEVPFFCKTQTAHRLPPLKELAPTELRRTEPAVYHSAIVHWGSLSSAFASLHIRYVFPEFPLGRDWHAKIVPFLGRLPDTMIARACSTNVEAIRALRRERGTPAFTRASLAA